MRGVNWRTLSKRLLESGGGGITTIEKPHRLLTSRKITADTALALDRPGGTTSFAGSASSFLEWGVNS